jgi:2-methylcitrate dehydratase PrpD
VEGAKVKPINPARAAVSGLLSCLWARKGFLGPSEIFEGEDGFLKAYGEGAKPDALVRGLGQEFEILNAYLKLYAACRHAHAPMDAALMILQREKIPLSQIHEIIVETYPAAVRLAGIRRATTPSAGRFSIPFSVALVMKEKSAGADKYSDRTIGDEAIQGLAQKVKLLGSAKWEEVYPVKRGATVTIVDAKGREFAAELDLAKGEPENPASWDEVYEKFRSNAGLLLSPAEVESLGNAIADLENRSIEAIVGMI